MKEQAILKFNDGVGALLCSKCMTIISTGHDFTENEWMSMKDNLKLPPQYCKDCREVPKNVNNENVTHGHTLTAVEWLVKKMNVLDNDSTIPISVTATKEIWNDIFEKAKAMEKEQVINACLHTASTFCDIKLHSIMKVELSLQGMNGREDK